jgi:hypothetical protein
LGSPAAKVKIEWKSAWQAIITVEVFILVTPLKERNRYADNA